MVGGQQAHHLSKAPLFPPAGPARDRRTARTWKRNYERAYESISIDTGRIAGASARNLSMTSARSAAEWPHSVPVARPSRRTLATTYGEVAGKPTGRVTSDLPDKSPAAKNMWLSDISASDDRRHTSWSARAQPGESGIRVGDLRQPGPELVNIRSLSEGHAGLSRRCGVDRRQPGSHLRIPAERHFRSLQAGTRAVRPANAGRYGT